MAAEAPTPPRGRAVRRALFACAVIALLVTVGAFGMRSISDDDQASAPADRQAVARTEVVRYDVRSVAADRRLVQTAVVPRGELAGRPLLVFLTGKGQDPAQIAGDHLRAAVGRLGDRAPVVLLPANDGGSYWHDRRSGRWERYVLDEALPAALRRFRLDGSRVAIGGISMGGAGAFGIAAHADRRFCAVGGHSTAFWTSADDTAPGAYDDADDFTRNAPAPPILAGTARYGVPLWIDIGRSDPFAAANHEVVAALKRHGEQITARTPEGDHDGRYWRDHVVSWMAFYAAALADC